MLQNKTHVYGRELKQFHEKKFFQFFSNIPILYGTTVQLLFPYKSHLDHFEHKKKKLAIWSKKCIRQGQHLTFTYA